VTVVTTKAPSGHRSKKAITVAAGATSVPVSVVGGATYDVYVTP
jgi:hypothetical protein